MKDFVLNIVLAFVWAILVGEINLQNLGLGYALGYIIMLASSRVLVSSHYTQVGWKVISLVAYFAWELIVTNFRLAYDVLTVHMNLMKPRILAIPLDLKQDIEITALANLLSLTPGSLSLDISSDHRVLYVHAMYAKDAKSAVQAIKNGMEKRLLELRKTDKDEI